MEKKTKQHKIMIYQHFLDQWYDLSAFFLWEFWIFCQNNSTRVSLILCTFWNMINWRRSLLKVIDSIRLRRDKKKKKIDSRRLIVDWIIYSEIPNSTCDSRFRKSPHDFKFSKVGLRLLLLSVIFFSTVAKQCQQKE